MPLFNSSPSLSEAAFCFSNIVFYQVHAFLKFNPFYSPNQSNTKAAVQEN